MSFPRYPTYKDSGVEWLGEVPEGWEIKNLQATAKRATYSFVDGPFGSDLKNEEYTESGVPLIQLNNISEGYHLLNEIKYVSEEKADELRKHNAICGDIVIAKMAHPVARAAIVKSDFSRYVIVADCIRLSVDEMKSHPIFLVYAINSSYFRTSAELVASGITRLRINLGGLKKLKVVLPPIAEQQTIATFLDRETAKIDAQVAEQENLIALLKEKRQAVISHAVTKGLDPTVLMKDSGIEWLGEVPAPWNVSPLRYLITSIGYGTSVNAIDNPASEGEYGVLKTSCVYSVEFNPEENKTVILEEYDRVSCPLRSGTLIVSRMNTPELVGAAGLVRAGRDGLFLPDRLWQVSFANAKASYIHYWTQTIHYRAQVKMACAGTSSSMQNLSQDQFNSFVLAIPRQIQEQDSIVAFLDTETAKLDNLTTEAQHTIELLKERRSALISAAVTGKIDVRGYHVHSQPIT